MKTANREERDGIVSQAVFWICVAFLVCSAIKMDAENSRFDAPKAAIMAKDIPAAEKCLQLLELLEPK